MYKKQVRLFKHETIIWFHELNDVIWLLTMKIRLKMKNRSNKYDINWTNPRQGHKYTKYEFCLSIIMTMCIKQHLRNIWRSVHEKVKQHWGWLKKSVAYKISASSIFLIWSRKQKQLFMKVILMYLNQFILPLYQTYKNLLEKVRHRLLIQL